MRPLKTHFRHAIVLSLVLVAPASCKPGDEASVKFAFPEPRLAKLRDPIPNRSLVASPLSDESVDRVCRYGRLRMMSYLDAPAYGGPVDEPEETRRNPEWLEFLGKAGAFKAKLKRLNVTFVTHATGQTAISFCNRYKTAEQMRTNSLQRRPSFRMYQDAGVPAIAYVDYQRCYFDRPDGTFHHWEAFRKTWTDVFGPLPEKIDPLLEHTVDGSLATRSRNTRYTFSPDAPHTLMRAFYCTGVDVNNGADGNYFDDQFYLASGDYGPYATANFQAWLAERFTPEQLADLFGTRDVSTLTPARAVGNKPLLSLKTSDVTPLTIAFLRYRAWRQGWLREQMRAFGRTINPHFVMTSTYWSHAGSPYVPTVHSASNIEQITRNGNRDTFLFWEPGTHGPGGGTPLAEARKPAAEGKSDVVYGRRSFACSYKQMVGASYVPVVTKQYPSGEQSSDLTELLYAEAWANLVSVRSGLHKPFSEEAIERMHAFQTANPTFFVGVQPYARVALLCSDNQAYLREQADATPFSRKLTDMGLEHQVIGDRKITADALAEFDMLILYQAALLSDAHMAAVDAFRKRGVLVVIGESGTHDEWGRPRPGGMARLVGERLLTAADRGPVVSADRHVVYCPLGELTRYFDDFWYRHIGDGDTDALREALWNTVVGKAWPHLGQHDEHVAVTLAHIPETGRLLAHVVNYNVRDTAQPSEPFELAIKLRGDRKPQRATMIAPELGKTPKPLPLRLVERFGARYGVVDVPSVRVYAIIAVD